MRTSLGIASLFQAVQSHGVLSTACLQALTIAAIDAMLQAGLGTPADDLQVFSQSTVRASQSAPHFGQAVLGGMGWGAFTPSPLWR